MQLFGSTGLSWYIFLQRQIWHLNVMKQENIELNDNLIQMNLLQNISHKH